MEPHMSRMPLHPRDPVPQPRADKPVYHRDPTPLFGHPDTQRVLVLTSDGRMSSAGCTLTRREYYDMREGVLRCEP